MDKIQLHQWQEKLFDTTSYIIYFLLFISFFGLSYSAPKYLEYLNYYVQIYIGLFLLWRFHPFRKKYKFTELDRKIAFSGGLFIFTITVLNQYMGQIIQFFK
jgi:drug/metabolite transporter (DMT)-like permease